MSHPGGGSVESYSVQGAEHDQLVDNSWIGWHHGEVLNIINLLVATNLGQSALVASSFHLVGVCLGMCASPLSTYFDDSVLWWIYNLNFYQFPSPTAILCFCIFICESEVAQSCLTLCDLMACSLPGFSVHGIF